MTDHPDLEALSAALDDAAGPAAAPLAAHLAGCATCRARQAELAAVRDAMSQPVSPPPSEVREAAISQALAAAEAWPGPAAAGERAPDVAPPQAAEAADTALVRRLPAAANGREREPARRPDRTRWWLTGSAAAAALAIVLGTVALVGRGDGQTGGDTALSARPGDQRAAAPEAAVTDSAVHGGDLGDVEDLASLRSRVAGATAAAAAPGEDSVAPSAAPVAGAAGAPPAPREVGTRVCEMEARTARPQLGPVVYVANLRFRGIPAVALGFRDPAGAAPVTLLVLAPEEACRLLAETTMP